MPARIPRKRGNDPSILAARRFGDGSFREHIGGKEAETEERGDSNNQRLPTFNRQG